MKPLDDDIAKRRQDRDALEGRFGELEQEKQRLKQQQDALPLTDAAKQEQIDTLNLQQDIARGGITQADHDINALQATQSYMEKVSAQDGPAQAGLPDIDTTQQAREDDAAKDALREQEDKQEHAHAVTEAIHGAAETPVQDAVQTVASLGIPNAQTEFMNLDTGHSMNGADAVVGLTLAGVAAADMAKQTYADFKRGSEARVEQAIRDNPPSEKEQQENAAREEIEQADMAKWQQRNGNDTPTLPGGDTSALDKDSKSAEVEKTDHAEGARPPPTSNKFSELSLSAPEAPKPGGDAPAIEQAAQAEPAAPTSNRYADLSPAAPETSKPGNDTAVMQQPTQDSPQQNYERDDLDR